MGTREDIAAIVADASSDKIGRIARLRAQRLREQIVNNLPFTWQPHPQVLVIIKGASLRGNAIELVIDLTIRGVTKSLTKWIEGRQSSPDWRVINPPLFVDDPTGDVNIGGRIGRDDFVAALKQVFTDTFGVKVADIVRSTAP